MKTGIILGILLGIFSVSITAQNLIGDNSEDIQKYIRKSDPELVLETGSVNDNYKYLKYTDGNKEMRTVFF